MASYIGLVTGRKEPGVSDCAFSLSVSRSLLIRLTPDDEPREKRSHGRPAEGSDNRNPLAHVILTRRACFSGNRGKLCNQLDGQIESRHLPTEERRWLTLPTMVVGFLISGSAYTMANLFPILATEHAGLSEASAGSIYIIGALFALSGPVWGWLSDHVSRKLVLSVRSIANTFSSLLYLLAPNWAGLATGRALDDVGKAAFRPAWGALMAHVAGVDKRRRARVMGYLSAADDAGEVAGPILAGLLWSIWGVPVVLGVRIALSVEAELSTTLLLRRLHDHSEKPLQSGPAPDGVASPAASAPQSRRERSPDEIIDG